MCIEEKKGQGIQHNSVRLDHLHILLVYVHTEVTEMFIQTTYPLLMYFHALLTLRKGLQICSFSNDYDVIA